MMMTNPPNPDETESKRDNLAAKKEFAGNLVSLLGAMAAFFAPAPMALDPVLRLVYDGDSLGVRYYRCRAVMVFDFLVMDT